MRATCISGAISTGAAPTARRSSSRPPATRPLEINSKRTGAWTNYLKRAEGKYKKSHDTRSFRSIGLDDIQLAIDVLTAIESIDINPAIRSIRNIAYAICTSLAGGNGTKYSGAHVDGEYARIGGEGGLPGYFTAKGAAPEPADPEPGVDPEPTDDPEPGDDPEPANDPEPSVNPAPTSIDGMAVTLSATSLPYNGKAQVPAVKTVGGKALVASTDYDVSYSNAASKNAGTYTLTVTGKGAYAGTATASYKIVQAKNSAKAAKAKVSKSFKAKALKKKAQTVKLPKVKAAFGKAKWAVAKKDKKKVLKLKGGKVVVKKGAKKGAYTIKLKAKVKATKNWTAAKTKTVTVKVKVK